VRVLLDGCWRYADAHDGGAVVGGQSYVTCVCFLAVYKLGGLILPITTSNYAVQLSISEGSIQFCYKNKTTLGFLTRPA
jgi:hypothetical protein